MENYKGIYYKDEKEQKYYEGGAHFKYHKLYKALLSLGGILTDDENNYNYNHSATKYKKKEHIKSNKDISSLLIKVKGKKSKYKTRNIAKIIYDNNPNTQIKKDNKFNVVNSLSIRDFNSRNMHNGRYIHKKYSYYKKAITSVSINNLHKNKLNSDLIKIILRKKEIDKKNQEKNKITKNILHTRNRSDFLSNMSTNTFNNNINCTQKLDIENRTFMKSLDNKNKLIKHNSNINNNNKSIEVNGQENEKKNDNDKPIIPKNKYHLIYGKSRIGMYKENSKNKSQFSLCGNKIKKTRNNIHKKIVNYNNTYENNKNNEINYKKKCINSYFFNNGKNKININVNKTINNNNISSVNANRFKDINIKNKEKILKSNGTNLILQKYIKKKINPMCFFNHKNCKKISKSIDQI